MAAPTMDHSLNDGLCTRLDSKLDSMIGRGARVALLDFPYNRNCGDAAIWVGERAVLRRLNAKIVYTCDTESYRPARLAERLGPDGFILLSGGGNFGDLWPEHQRLRNSVLQDFPGHAVVQLPQSIAVRDVASLVEIEAVMSAHTQLRVLLRDHASVRVAQDELHLDAELCPDAAFGLSGILRRRREPTDDFLVLARTDQESASDLASIGLPNAVISEWRQTRAGQARWRSKKIVPRLAKRWHDSPALDRLTTPPREACYSAMVRQLVREAVDQLSQYRVIVTDRLHAHVLATLLGIPHVVVDNANGKVGELHRAWTLESKSTRFCNSLDEARAAALELLDAHGRR